MFRIDGIQCFLDNVDPKIFARGLDYYESGNVEDIDCDGGHVTAEVSGSDVEPYLVEIDLDENGGVEYWECDCPYDWGPVCKHTVAALLALQAEPPEEAPKEPPKDTAKRTAALKKLVEQADKKQLAALVLEHCREDVRFQSQVLSELGDGGEQELESIQELVRETIRANTHRGIINEDGCDNICADLDDALDKARRRLRQGQWGRALDITRFVLLTCMKLAEEADSGFGSLDYTITAALDTVGLAADGLAESGEDRSEDVKGLLETAQDPVFDGWATWRYDLLRRTAVLADSENEMEFYDALARLSDRRWEAFEDAPRYDEQDRLIRYYVIRYAHGPQEGRAYLKRNLAVDEFRLILVQEYMDDGDYAEAESLCRERVEKEDLERSWSRPSQWQYLLYEIYQNWGQREKQVKQARKLALMGDREFCQSTKELLTEDGHWTEEYPGFLSELKAVWPACEYMEILARENEVDLLMEQVRCCPDEVFHYGALLAPRYGKEVCGLCSGVIREVSKDLQNWRDYKRVCELLRLLADFGGTAEAKTLIGELRQAYPRRPALRDELERVERKIGESRGR